MIDIVAEQLLRLELFRALTKDGCEWRGDIVSKQWAEELFFTEGAESKVMDTLEFYPDNSYKLCANRVLIR